MTSATPCGQAYTMIGEAVPMEQTPLDTAAIRAADPGAVDLMATVSALCGALDAARAQLREAVRALELGEADARRAAERLEGAKRARTAADVERGRFQLLLNAVRVECHRVLDDRSAGPERREV